MDAYRITAQPIETETLGYVVTRPTPIKTFKTGGVLPIFPSAMNATAGGEVGGNLNLETCKVTGSRTSAPETAPDPAQPTEVDDETVTPCINPLDRLGRLGNRRYGTSHSKMLVILRSPMTGSNFIN